MKFTSTILALSAVFTINAHEADTEYPALSACIDTYPGYEGDIDVSIGSKIVIKFNEEDMMIRYNLRGVEESCVDCGVHIHTGTTCDDASLVGGHYWDAAKVEDPWTTAGGSVYASDVDGRAKGSFSLTAGTDWATNEGHAVVVHAADGTRVGCGVLSRGREAALTCTVERTKLQACIDPYPDYTGDLTVRGKIMAKYDVADLQFRYNLRGVESNCVDCGVHIHTGTTCSDASLVGGHYWDAAKVEDPWTTAGGSVYSSNAAGHAKDKFKLNAGYGTVENVGHAVVVHAADGTRIGCGVLSAEKATGCMP